MTATAPVVDFHALEAVPDIRIPLTFTALSDICHGAGVSGNTQLLRTRPVLTPTGRATVPYVSGISFRSQIRKALGWYLVRTLEVEAGTLPKPVTDLIWTGGAITTTGSQADLAMMRRMHRLIPGLGLLGYSAKSDIVQGTMQVDFIDLVCRENAHLLPPRLRQHPHAQLPAGAMRSEEFGTRHDAASSPVGRFIALAETDTIPGAGKEPAPVGTVQMIHKVQTIKTGSVLYSEIRAAVPTAGHVAALAVGLDEVAPERNGERITYLGGRRSSGYGRCRLEADTTGLGGIAEMAAQYREHMVRCRSEILELLAEIVG